MTPWIRLTLSAAYCCVCCSALLRQSINYPTDRQLGIIVRSRHQSHIRLAHEFSCRKHGVHLARAGPRNLWSWIVD